MRDIVKNRHQESCREHGKDGKDDVLREVETEREGKDDDDTADELGDANIVHALAALVNAVEHITE